MWKNSKTSKIRIGDRFGRYTVEGLPESQVRGKCRVMVCRCACDCGNRKEVPCGNLLRDDRPSLSCGCRKPEVTAERSRTHCFTGTRIYRIWINMVNRCENSKSTQYDRYGGRGIQVCPEWRASFEAFFDWAMTNGYQHHLTIDRRENDGGYCPENCRWVDMVTQQNNRSSTRIIEAFGEQKSIMEWSRDPRCTIDYSCLFWRINRGVDPERAIAHPARIGKNKNVFGTTRKAVAPRDAASG